MEKNNNFWREKLKQDYNIIVDFDLKNREKIVEKLYSNIELSFKTLCYLDKLKYLVKNKYKILELLIEIANNKEIINNLLLNYNDEFGVYYKDFLNEYNFQKLLSEENLDLMFKTTGKERIDKLSDDDTETLFYILSLKNNDNKNFAENFTPIIAKNLKNILDKYNIKPKNYKVLEYIVLNNIILKSNNTKYINLLISLLNNINLD